MINSILSGIFVNQWCVIGVSSVLLVAAAEIGFQTGLQLYRASDDARKGQIGGIQGAILGLLGLLLGFTFAMAVARYETRRELVLKEANAIGTTYLRASLLTETHQAGVESLLRRYVDARIDFYEAGQDRERQDAAEAQAAQIQHELWAHAVSAGKESPTAITTSFISALNDVIDLDTTRMNALRTHVPGAVWLLVLGVAVCGSFASGYAAGASGARSGFANFVMPLMIAVVITLIADLDRPRGGLIEIKQQPLLDLRQSINMSRP